MIAFWAKYEHISEHNMSKMRANYSATVEHFWSNVEPFWANHVLHWHTSSNTTFPLWEDHCGWHDCPQCESTEFPNPSTSRWLAQTHRLLCEPFWLQSLEIVVPCIPYMEKRVYMYARHSWGAAAALKLWIEPSDVLDPAGWMWPLGIVMWRP